MVFSNYKHRTTLKAIVRISPAGCLTFASNLFTGSMTDLEIVKRSGILELFDPQDQILVDRGVNILEECASRGITMTMPSFLNGRDAFTPDEMMEFRQVSLNARPGALNCTSD